MGGHQLREFLGQHHQIRYLITLLDEECEIFVNKSLIDSAEIGMTEELL
jgi:hypothetical protein